MTTLAAEKTASAKNDTPRAKMTTLAAEKTTSAKNDTPRAKMTACIPPADSGMACPRALFRKCRN